MSSFTRISALDALALIQSEPVSIVDIRDPNSYQLGHIKNASHLDNSTAQTFIEQALFEQPLIVYCYHGHSSQSAAGWLAQQGFEKVYSLDGGYAGWKLSCPQEIEVGADH